MKPRALGIDHGEARIGLAMSDDLWMLAHPLETLQVSAGDPVEAIARIVEREKIGPIVLGIPRNMNGTYGPAAEKTRAFAARLRERLGRDIREWDERLTTMEAQRALHASGRDVKKSRKVIDQVAAQIILQGFLDSQSFIDG